MAGKTSDLQISKFAERLREVTSSNRSSIDKKIATIREVSQHFAIKKMTAKQVSLAYAELCKQHKEKQANENEEVLANKK